jgi:glycerophosphoryl diester phosphodiesterase
MLGTALGASLWSAEPAVTPLPNAHAHNDYFHRRPLLDALEQGFCSVEADIHLVEGQLLVAHDRSATRPERTLEALYLRPLRERVRANHGTVHPGAREFFLLIDFKTGADTTYEALRRVLQHYSDFLTRFRPEATDTNAVTIIISGNRPREMLAAEFTRLAAMDGRIPDLDGKASQHFIPWISDNWLSHFKWRGQGPMPADEKAKLRQLVEKAHQQGRRVRFWGAPDVEAIWQEQTAAGVDFINADKLADLRQFLLTSKPPGVPAAR